MRAKLLVLVLLFAVIGWGQSIFNNPITGTNPNTANPYTAGQAFDTNITVVGISRTGLTGTNANDRYNAQNWSTSSSIDLNKYFELRLTPVAGYQINFLELEYTSQASPTGPSRFAVRSSLDGYDANLGSPTAAGATINLSGAQFQNVTGVIIFRIYAWDANASTGTYSINDFDFKGTVTSICVPPTITFVPASGPVGTEVTITASSGSLTGATATFSGIPAAVVSNNGTVMVVEVPVGANTGEFIIQDGTGCKAKKTFTVRNTEGVCGNLPDLIMTEIYDHSSGALGYIEIYNGTGATINLATYTIRRYGDAAALSANNSVTYSFPSGLTIGNGVVLVGRLSTAANVGGVVPDFDFVNGSGINGDDIFHLYRGAAIIDVFEVPTSIAGYDYRRNVNTLGNNYTSNPSDWGSFSGTSDLKNFSYVGSSTAPTINTHPIDITGCDETIQFSVIATPYGAGTLTYQWFYNNGASNAWTQLIPTSFAGITITGETGSTVTFTGSVSTIYGYQFYCRVTQGGCSVISNAAQIKTQATIWTAGAWTKGIPDISKVAILNDNYNTATHGSFSCCSLEVRSTRALTIAPNTYVEIQNRLYNLGTVLIQNDGQLVQINESDNNSGTYTGTRFQVDRTAKNIQKFDYVYWSAPVEGFNLSGINGTHKYYWDTTAANINGSQGNWLPASGLMNKGQGYIVRGPAANVSPADVPVSFRGKPHNGQFTYPVTKGSNLASLNDNLVLVGNPYPSAIDADVFLEINDAVIEGAVRIWTHGNLPSNVVSNPFYQNFSYNYNPNDYIVYNGTATTIPGVFDGKIASGQSFFVTMLESGAATKNLVFTNAMRGNTTSGILDNSTFFRTIPQHRMIEKHRIWLDILGDNHLIGRTIVVGYVPNATMAKDNRYDAYAKMDDGLNLYSLIGEETMQIQGRALPFNELDIVPLGIMIPTGGAYKIAISHLDGVFSGNQTVFLEDKQSQIIHDLKAGPYSFVSDKGQFNNRFILRYTNETLSVIKPETAVNEVIVYSKQNTVVVTSSNDNLKEVKVFDMLGRQLYQANNLKEKVWELTSMVTVNQPLILHITLENGVVMTKKVLH